MTTLNVAIYLFDQVEVLDFAGPFEVFTTASRVHQQNHASASPPFNVFTVCQSNVKPVSTRAQLNVLADHSISNHPDIDLLVIPGGIVEQECENASVIAWVAAQAQLAQITASVCTGAFILGQANLLRDHTVTTHWEDIADLKAQFPNSHVIDNLPWVDQGKIITSAGISAGIDMSLYLVERLYGKELANATAKQMQYRWTNTL